MSSNVVYKPLVSMGVTVHADAPPVGFVDTRALPAPSTATQSVVDGQDTAAIALGSVRFDTVHTGACGVGTGVAFGCVGALVEPHPATANATTARSGRDRLGFIALLPFGVGFLS
jgi:hypothetical protein